MFVLCWFSRNFKSYRQDLQEMGLVIANTKELNCGPHRPACVNQVSSCEIRPINGFWSTNKIKWKNLVREYLFLVSISRDINNSRPNFAPMRTLKSGH
ncbi:hypothetical protein RCL_jg22456.t1 [Rhizophagus clarus]|uniref:Uncharacterized protein n=1 Tax=Rhizophagus clarus TaxID=94130 RepID=A0A8H3R4V8_9GLOM|nr:hypothetical protein RCL_jg22456.t1 [Rhizophagus clarus]